MDHRLTIFLWTLGGTCFLGLIGALFGALAGALARMKGSAPGSLLGSHVLRAFERVHEKPLSPTKAGAIVGAVDGASFLGAVGCLLGLLAGYGEWISTEFLVVIFIGIAVLAILAVHFGVLAYGFIHVGSRAFGGSCVGGLAGAVAGAVLGGGVLIFIGAEVGAVSGLIAALLTRRAGTPRNDWSIDPGDDDGGRRHFRPDTNIHPNTRDAIRPAWDQFRFKEREP